ncbi:hypothetical protein JCM10212_006465 [Sporobolomyces blumeae]
MKFGLDPSDRSGSDSDDVPVLPVEPRYSDSNAPAIYRSTRRLASPNPARPTPTEFEPTPVKLPHDLATSRSRSLVSLGSSSDSSSGSRDESSRSSDSSGDERDGREGRAFAAVDQPRRQPRRRPRVASRSRKDEVGHDGESDFDSEEEQWPVGPRGSVGLRGWQREATRRPSQGFGGSKLFGGKDQLDQWDDQGRATVWANANRTFRLSLARSMSTSPSLVRPAHSSSSTDATSLDALLSRLALQHSQETAALVSAFEKRNTALWESIERSIRVAEEEEGERQRVLEENRKRMEEQERKAREMRELEAKRQEEERKKEEEKKREQERKREEERLRIEEEKRRIEEKDRAEQSKQAALGTGAGSTPKDDWEKWTKEMERIKRDVLPVVSGDPALRKACFQAKRAITPKIGQLTSSAEAISRIISQLDQLLSSVRAASPGGETYTWTLNHLSKALVKQAETEVTAKLGTAYPLGRVVIGLLTRGHTQLGHVLMARLVKKCFWITAHFPSKQPGQTDEAFQKTLGHAPPGSSETLVQYAERMAGLVALYASIVSCSPLEAPQGPCPAENVANVPPQFRPSAGWRWMVMILRRPLVTLEPTPLLLVTFLEVAGPTLLECFGHQFEKYLELVLRVGIRDGKNEAGFNDKSRSSRVRLELWLEEWEKNGEIKEIQGRSCDP